MPQLHSHRPVMNTQGEQQQTRLSSASEDDSEGEGQSGRKGEGEPSKDNEGELLEERALHAQQVPDFYTNAAAYWEKVPPTVNGMLGGFARISNIDIQGSEALLKSLFRQRGGPGHGRAVDCGAGIGRITKSLLQKHFGKVDLVEQCQIFLDKAKELFKGSGKIGEYVCEGLQDFNPEPGTYDVVWVQWVLGHLTDSDLESFFRRMAVGLKPSGVVVVKENVTSSGEVELDEQDSSVTRPQTLLLDIIHRANLQVFKNVKQPSLPEGLYEVKMLCLRPKTDT